MSYATYEKPMGFSSLMLQVANLQCEPNDF